MRKLVVILVALSLTLGAAACGESNADKVGDNLGKEAEKFNVQRKILFVNAPMRHTTVIDLSRVELETLPYQSSVITISP